MKNLSSVFILASFLLLGCSTQTPTLRVKTVPDSAQIAVRTADGDYKILGKGPLEISTSEVFSLGSRVSLVKVSKENYKAQSVLLVQGKNPENYELVVELDRELEDPKANDMRERQEKLAKSLAQANNLMFQKKYEEAEIILKNLTNEFPHLSVAYDLLGNLYYLQRNMRSALQNYEKAYQINPENFETKRMIEKIKQSTGTWSDL